jgi:phenylacetic acid degradation operon negative regulatory protein
VRRPIPKTLILDLLSKLGGHAMPVRALVAAAAVFGLRPESVRVALVRLGERGTVTRDERGWYRLAAAAEPVQQHVSGWKKLDERITPWRGSWIAVHTGHLGRSERKTTRRRERALHWMGFRVLAGHLYIRPDNLRGGVDGVRAQLLRLGLEARALVFALTELDADADSRARRLWDTAALRRLYREAAAALTSSAARLESLPSEQAMKESFLLGGEAIRHLAHDPLLPESIAPTVERNALVATLRDYDRQGRMRWRAFLESHGAREWRAPRATASAVWPMPMPGEIT